MRHFIDKKMKGHALIFDGPLDLIAKAREANEKRPFQKNTRIHWPGRQGTTWADMEKFVRSPWPEAAAMIKRVVEAIHQTEMPTPKDVKRRPRMTDDDGEIDIDRALKGEPEFYRQIKRQRVTGPFQISLVGNLDLSCDHKCNASGVFYRSACCIAVADILESMGYTCEIWIWCRGGSVFPDPYPNQFVAYRPKKMGDPIDLDALCDAMSEWFTTKGIFGSFATCPDHPISFGYAYPANNAVSNIEEAGMGSWIKYLDIEQGSLAVAVPDMSAWSMDGGIRNAATAAKTILQRVIDAQS